jgi:ADP-ribosylglycohydrolase
MTRPELSLLDDPEAVRDRFRGCLLAGAVGDALGAPIEFWSLNEVRQRLGSEGLTDYVSVPANYTDDTQMSLFTAEGLIRASIRMRSKGICYPPAVIYHAYMRWLYTQDGPSARADWNDGWLVKELRMHQRRAPGNTCLSALRSGEMGQIDRPLNDSKGCGGVMRTAPVGLLVGHPDQAFRMGCEAAAITHGHPSGWLPAGVLAAVVAMLIDDFDIETAVRQAREILLRWEGHEETANALDAAVELASSGLPEPTELEGLGGGWVGEEALSIAVCCAIAAPDLRSGLLASVNHSGDSDSIGAICGNILGAANGYKAIPDAWVNRLEDSDLVLRLADDLWEEQFDDSLSDDWGSPPDHWWNKYPGW